MLLRAPATSLMENLGPCQVKQGRPRELQRPAECTGALEFPGKARGICGKHGSDISASFVFIR